MRTLTQKDIDLFAVMSGDVNPACVDEAFARSDMFHKVVAHGMWGGALISTVLGTELPGPGTIYAAPSRCTFLRPVGLGDTITVTVMVARQGRTATGSTFDCRASNQSGEEVITGTAEVIAPTEKISRPRIVLPDVELRRSGRQYERLVEMTRVFDPIRTAMVHPVDTPSLLGAVEAARAKLITPVLVGPEHKIRAAAAQAGLDLAIRDRSDASTATPPPRQAVALARAGKVEALMKGASIPTS